MDPKIEKMFDEQRQHNGLVASALISLLNMTSALLVNNMSIFAQNDEAQEMASAMLESSGVITELFADMYGIKQHEMNDEAH